MSTQANNNTLADRIHLDEKDSTTIENPPSDIKQQLKAAEFQRKSSDVYVKKRQPYSESSTKTVVEVQIQDNSLTLSSESVVGVVNLTPTSKVQIDPSIGWSDILEMFLAVQEKNRSIEYQGIPIREFLGDNLEIEDIFVVIAVNYLNSLEPVWREGLVRDFKRNEYDALRGKGKIDLQQSLLNRVRPKNSHLQRFVEKKVNYDVPVHRLFHRAGKELLKLFNFYSSDYSHNGYYRVFEELERTVKRFEEHGIRSSSTEHQIYKNVSVNDLPPTRHYYKEAIKTSKMILSSSIGKPMESGEQDLTMDYIINMNDLFEKYSQIVLEEELDKIKNSSEYTGSDSVHITANRKINLFQDDTNLKYIPDHVVTYDGESIAVLDSKYYSGNKNPLKDNYARSRLFSYAYYLEVEELAFLVPSEGTQAHPITGKDGDFTVVAPSEFEIEDYRNSVKNYLQGLLSENLVSNPLKTDLQKHDIPISEVQCDSLDEVFNLEVLNPKKVKNKSSFIIRNIANEYSSEAGHSRNVKRKQIAGSFNNLFNHHDGNDYAVPIFRSADAKNPERILIHFLKLDDESEIEEHTICGPYEIGWTTEKEAPLIEIEEKEAQ